MAAHVWTALNQLREDHIIKELPVNWDAMKASLNFSCWTELLDLDDYIDLRGYVDDEDTLGLVFWIGTVFSKYKAKWDKLGQPTTMGAWVDQAFFMSGMHE